MSGVLEFTVLGCGSSGGVPRADGDWGACNPAEPKNQRSRCSLLVRRLGEGAEQETTLIVDTSPDLRLQTANSGAKRLDGILLTHDHADQVHGVDDVRAFFIRQRTKIACHMDIATDALDDAALRLHLRAAGRLSSDLRAADDPVSRTALGGQ